MDGDIEKRTKIEGVIGVVPEAAYSSGLRSPFDELEDELVVEILHRLTKADLTVNCELVCKRWYSIITSSLFIRRFIDRHASLNQTPIAIIVNCYGGERELHVISDQLSNTSGFLFSYLPEKNTDTISVIATFKDLVIYRVRIDVQFWRHYICNPFTKKWVALPLISQTRSGVQHVGLVFEEDNNNSSCFNDYYQRRFRVVCMLALANHRRVCVKTYCSETGKWDESAAPLDRKYCPIRTRVVSYKGKLWWYTGKRIAVYDPFNTNPNTLHKASLFKYTAPHCIKFYCLGVCRDSLRLVRFVTKGSPLDGYTKLTTIWELKDDDATPKWSLEHEVCFNQMDCENSHVQLCISSDSSFAIKPLSIHPNDWDIIYCLFGLDVVSCNMRTKRMTVVASVPNGSFFNVSRFVFPVVHQWWPTKVPEVPPSPVSVLPDVHRNDSCAEAKLTRCPTCGQVPGPVTPV